MKITIREYFKKHTKIGDLAEREIDDLKKIFLEKNFKKDDVIFKENEMGDRMYFIIDGLVKIYLTDLEAGKTIALMKKGEMFGELAFFDRQPHSAEAVALTETGMFVLDLNKFKELRQSNPGLALKIIDIILNTVAKRLRGTTRKMYGLY